jgi:hypothetical protein
MTKPSSDSPWASGKCFKVVRLLPLRFTSNSILLLTLPRSSSCDHPRVRIAGRRQRFNDENLRRRCSENRNRSQSAGKLKLFFCFLWNLCAWWWVLCSNWHWIVFLMVNLERIGVELCLLRWFQWLKEFVRVLLGWRVGRVKTNWWLCFDELAMSLWCILTHVMSWLVFIGQLVNPDPMSLGHLYWTVTNPYLAGNWLWGPLCNFETLGDHPAKNRN